MDLKILNNIECVRKPEGIKGTQFEKLMKLISDKYHVILNDYWDLYKWSVENIPEFWAEVWRFGEIKCSRTFDQVVDLSCPMSGCPKWFMGARLNFAENLLKYKDDKTSIIAIGENREKRIFTFADVYEQTKLYASAFRKLGLQKGDRVVCYISNREEAIFCILAATSIGAVWIGILALLGAQAVIERLEQVNPKFIFVGDGFHYDGQEYDMLSKVKHISKALPTLERVIIVPTLHNSTEKDIKDIPNSCFLNEFLDFGRNVDGSAPDIEFEQLPLSHPFQINYTSGTTGPSKPIIHDSGYLLTLVRDVIFQHEVDRNARALIVSGPGWASWNMALTPLCSGSGLVLYDGLPYFLTPTYFWDLIDEYDIKFFFVYPSILDDLEKKEYVPGKNHKLTSLKIIYSGGSVTKIQNFNFVYQKIKPEIAFSSVYGFTESLACILYMHSSLPICKGEISCPALGCAIECVNDTGEPVTGEFGDLVISKPYPSLLSGVYGDTDGSRLKEKYFSKYLDKFNSGDIAAINPVTKGMIIYGRSDEAIKQFGLRFAGVDIYNVVNKLPEIYDSLCVNQYSKSMTERVVLFLKMKKGFTFDAELTNKVKDVIENELTHKHVPGLIMEVPEIPYNINGKKMELLVKKLINGLPYKSDVLINQDCLKYFKDVPPYLD